MENVKKTLLKRFGSHPLFFVLCEQYNPTILTMIPSPCCPPGGLGPAPLCDRTPKGKMIEWDVISSSASSSKSPLSKLRVYKVGDACGTSGGSDIEVDNTTTSRAPHRAVVVFTDVYGLDSGNHQVFCDTIQERLNTSYPTTVYCPDLFHGRPLMHQWGLSDDMNATLGGLLYSLWGIRGRCSAVNIDRNLMEIIQPNIRATGCMLPCGVVGFCFGGWVVGRALSVNDTNNVFGAGVGIHPAFQIEPLAYGGTTEMELAERTRNKPVLFLPAKQDVGLKPETDVVKYMARRRAKTPDQISIPFESMPHGFVARGDFLGLQYKDAQEKAIGLTVDFLEEHIKE
jgi:dienelactone hydrolase